MFDIKNDFIEANDILNKFINNEKNFNLLKEAGETMVQCILNKGKIFSCGNGGSMCDAMHFAEELTGRFRNNRQALPAIAICDPTHISCVGNDFGYEYIFSRYIEALGSENDVLLAISTSGNSINIINAIEVAKKKGMLIIGLTGKDGGKIGTLCDIEIRAPYSHYSDRSQEIHIKCIHSLINYIENNL